MVVEKTFPSPMDYVNKTCIWLIMFMFLSFPIVLIMVFNTLKIQRLHKCELYQILRMIKTFIHMESIEIQQLSYFLPCKPLHDGLLEVLLGGEAQVGPPITGQLTKIAFSCCKLQKIKQIWAKCYLKIPHICDMSNTETSISKTAIVAEDLGVDSFRIYHR